MAALLLAGCLWIASAVPAGAEPPGGFVTRDLVMYEQDGVIRVRVGVSVDNESSLAAMLRDGASVQLTAALKLERLRTLWSNLVLAEQTYGSTLRHNPLTREFTLHMPGGSAPVTDRNLHRLLSGTWRNLSFPVTEVDTVRREAPGQDYRITLALTLQHTEVPPWLARAFAFWSKDVVDPVTLVVPFSR